MKLRGKRKEVKQYIKYENGDFVSIEVAQDPKPYTHDPYQQVDIVPEKRFHEKVRDTLKSFFTRKRLKLIAFIIVSILFVSALYDTFYVIFSTPTPRENKDATGTSELSLSPTPSQIVPTPVETQPGTVKAEPSSKPTDVATPSPKQPVPTKQEDESSIVKNLLAVANQVNTSMILATNDEVRYIDSYQNKQANKIGLQSSLVKNRKQKEELFTTLNSYKAIFQKQGMDKFYQATENRLLDSLLFSKQAMTWLDSGSGTIASTISEYGKKDDDMRKAQQDELIEVLDNYKIPYKVNDQQTQVDYTLQ